VIIVKPFLFDAQPYSPALHISSLCLPFPASHAMHLFTFLGVLVVSPVSSWFLSIFVPGRDGASIWHVAGIHRTFAPPHRPGEFAFQRHLDRQTDHATCVATGRIFTLRIAMRAKNYSERQNCRHQFRRQHDDEISAVPGKIVLNLSLFRHCNTTRAYSVKIR